MVAIQSTGGYLLLCSVHIRQLLFISGNSLFFDAPWSSCSRLAETKFVILGNKKLCLFPSLNPVLDKCLALEISGGPRVPDPPPPDFGSDPPPLLAYPRVRRTPKNVGLFFIYIYIFRPPPPEFHVGPQKNRANRAKKKIALSVFF